MSLYRIEFEVCGAIYVDADSEEAAREYFRSDAGREDVGLRLGSGDALCSAEITDISEEDD